MRLRSPLLTTLLFAFAHFPLSAQAPAPLNTWRLSGNSDVQADSFLGTWNTRDLVFKTNLQERMRVTGDGHILTGDWISGSSFVHGDSNFVDARIYDTSGDRCYFVIDTDGSGASPVLFLRSGNQYGFAEAVIETSDDLRFRVGGGPPPLYLLNAGRVGINTDAPLYELHVEGSIYAADQYLGSDLRYKKNITPVAHALPLIQQLRPVSYERRTDEFEEKNFPEGRTTGFIAQELETVLPELVSTDTNGFKAVNYVGVIPLLVRAVQEQQEVIERQQRAIDTLIEALDSRR